MNFDFLADNRRQASEIKRQKRQNLSPSLRTAREENFQSNWLEHQERVKAAEKAYVEGAVKTPAVGR